MSESAARSGGSGGPPVEEIADRLYGLPPAEFTKSRNAAVDELREAGQREAAQRVKALAKPTVAAAAVNQLVRRHRADVERFLRAATVLRDAQFAGKGDLAAATRQEREQLERVVELGGEAVRQTLLAAAADEEAARQVLEARLVRDLELRGFGTLLAHADPTALKRREPTAPERPGAAAVQARPTPSGPAKPDDRAALARLEAATAALESARAGDQDARSRRERADRELDDARAAAEKARAAADEARRVASEAREAADEARRAASEAQAAVDEARREVEAARAAVGEA